MEPHHYLRLLRRRWIALFILVALGASVGYASTLVTEEAEIGPVITRWAAAEVLVMDGSQNLDLRRLAVFATKGSVPDEVAAARGLDPAAVSASLRTVSDGGEGTLTISAVGTSAADASEISEEIATALLAELASDNQAIHDQAIRDLEAQRDTALEIFTSFTTEITLLEGIAAAGSLSAEQRERLNLITAEREGMLSRFTSAGDALRDLETTGPAPSGLEVLDAIPPFRISEREYNRRIAEGRQGQTNFDAGKTDLADTSSPTVSERLASPAMRAALGAVAGLLLAIMLIIAVHRLDPRLRSRQAIEDAFGLPVLAEVPLIARKECKSHVLHTRDKSRSVVAESYRYLRSALLFAGQHPATHTTSASPTTNPADGPAQGLNREQRVLMVTSAGSGEGKSTTAANLAVLMAESGYDTILINCDFRLPTVHEFFGLEYQPATVLDTGIPNLRFIGDVIREENETPGQVSERQRALIRRARDAADLLILDTAPVLATNDAIDLLPEVDLVVLVARESQTTGEAARDAVELLVDRMGAPIVGVVATAAGTGMGGSYYERYRYGAYFTEDEPLWKLGKGQLTRTKPSRAEAKAARAAAKAEKAAQKAGKAAEKVRPQAPVAEQPEADDDWVPPAPAADAASHEEDAEGVVIDMRPGRANRGG